MNYYYDDIEEIEDVLYKAEHLSDDEFEDEFNMDAVERTEFIQLLNEDLVEISKNKQEPYSVTDNWKEAYAYPGVIW